MIKKEGSKGVVVGGNKLSPQQYTGTVGGQSTDYVTITTEVKTAGLQGDSLAPPDLCVPNTPIPLGGTIY